MSIVEETRYIDILKQGVSTPTFISVSLAEFKQKMSAEDNKRQYFQEAFMTSQYYQQLTGERRNNVVFLVSRKHHICGAQCRDSAPRPAGTAFSTASNSPPRHSSDWVR
jgi:hypothetical protein